MSLFSRGWGLERCKDDIVIEREMDESLTIIERRKESPLCHDLKWCEAQDAEESIRLQHLVAWMWDALELTFPDTTRQMEITMVLQRSMDGTSDRQIGHEPW